MKGLIFKILLGRNFMKEVTMEIHYKNHTITTSPKLHSHTVMAVILPLHIQ